MALFFAAEIQKKTDWAPLDGDVSYSLSYFIGRAKIRYLKLRRGKRQEMEETSARNLMLGLGHEFEGRAMSPGGRKSNTKGRVEMNQRGDDVRSVKIVLGIIRKKSSLRG